VVADLDGSSVTLTQDSRRVMSAQNQAWVPNPWLISLVNNKVSALFLRSTRIFGSNEILLHMDFFNKELIY
jgi:hypothetical protein